MRTKLIEPSTEQILRYCAAAPVERVFLEDVARRAQGRFAAVADGDDDLSLVARWSQRLRDNGFESVLVMRLLFLPYDLVSYMCGGLRIRWTSFLLATVLGSLPGTISFVLLGASLERVDQGLDGINAWATGAGAAIFVVSIVISRLLRKGQR